MYFQRLRDLREDSDMNQTQIAEILFTSQTVYSRYERGARTIPVEHLLILADFYGVSTDYILGRTNNKKLNKQKTGSCLYLGILLLLRLAVDSLELFCSRLELLLSVALFDSFSATLDSKCVIRDISCDS